MEDWQLRDAKAVWHPYTQMKTGGNPSVVVSASGAWLQLSDGRKILDAIGSWWVNLHGHTHPKLVAAIQQQVAQLEQVIFAGFTHTPAIQLAEKILQHLPWQAKVFYSDNGSTAVEVAIKMAIQYWYNQGEVKPKLLAFQHAYHGDTFGAMAVSGRSAFTLPYADNLFETTYLPDPIPQNRKEIEEMIIRVGEEGKTAAFIYEPLVMGAGGMICYAPEELEYILTLAKKYHLLLIADEVMTGFGRTGTLFASNQIALKPDLMCLSKGLTGGFLPLGITTANAEIFQAFWSDDRMKTLFHGHSFTANPMACAVGVASLDLLEDPEYFQNISRISRQHQAVISRFQKYPSVNEVRSCGVIFAITLEDGGKDSQYLSWVGPYIYQWFLDKNILLRPLGNVLYLLPPYCITDAELEWVYQTIEIFLKDWENIQTKDPIHPGAIYG